MENQQRILFKDKYYKQHLTYSDLCISEDGEIYSIKTQNIRYTYIGKSGYRIIQVYIEGKRKTLKVHRLVADIYLEQPDKDLIDFCNDNHWKVPCVKHKDNNKLNNHFTNLMWDTQAENNKDAWKDGLVKPLKGESNGRATLTEELVHILCEEFEKGMAPKEATSKYEVSIQQASKIRCGIAWKHISEQYNIKPLKQARSETSRKA